MSDLAASDRLPLTCTRQGHCCAGHRIPINPWELARLAATVGCAPAEFRARHTVDGGLYLRFAGSPGWSGKPTCDLYDHASGCTAHPGRPLACRLYPIGRRRSQGRVVYHAPAEGIGCATRCPRALELPHLTVGDYLAEQDVAAPERAHDAYANLVYGLVAAAASILAHLPDREAVRERCAALLADPAAALAAIPEPWLDLLLAPALTTPLDQIERFVEEHRALVMTTLQREFGAHGRELRDAVALLAALGAHLAPTVGGDRDAMRELLGIAPQRV